MNTTIIETFGAQATTLTSTLKKADLNWEPLSDKVGGMDTAIEMPHKKLLYRSDTKAPLGIVGVDYHPSSPKEFLKSQFDVAEMLKGKVGRAGFLKDRSRAFAFVELDKGIEIRKKAANVGDPLACYVYSTDGWDGGTPRRSRLYVERLKCKNGMTSREIHTSLWVSHTSGMADRFSKAWKKFVAEIGTQVATIQNQFNKLAQTGMTQEQMLDFAMKLLPGEHGRTASRRNEIVNLFTAGTGVEGNTRWDAYNAVTEFVTHHRSYRATDTTSAETNRFLGVLETDTLNNKALNLLLN